MTKNFYNNWDLKSIISIALLATTLGGGAIAYGELKGDVRHLKAQRDIDIQTVKDVRSDDMENINKKLDAILEMQKEMRNDIKGKKDK